MPTTDNEQGWIEKYRTALAQPAPSGRARLVAAWNTLAKTLGFAVGKTSGKLANAVQSPVVSSPSQRVEAQEHPRTHPHSRQESASKKSPPLEHQQDKKAS